MTPEQQQKFVELAKECKAFLVSLENADDVFNFLHNITEEHCYYCGGDKPCYCTRED